MNFRELEKEMKLDFAEEYWKGYLEEEEEKYAETEEQKQARLAIEEINKSIEWNIIYYHEDAVKHFLEKKCLEYDDEGRYFYKTDELIKFANEYVSKGGKLEDLGCWEVKEDWGERYCYEVVRLRYLDKVKLEGKVGDEVEWEEVMEVAKNC